MAENKQRTKDYKKAFRKLVIEYKKLEQEFNNFKLKMKEKNSTPNYICKNCKYIYQEKNKEIPISISSKSFSPTEKVENNLSIDDNINIIPFEDMNNVKKDDRKLDNHINSSINIKPKRFVTTESKKILNKIIKDTYEYYDKHLPERNIINFDNFNKNIKCIHITKIKNIFEFYEIYEKYINSGIDKESSRSFHEYMNYNNSDFSMKYFSNFYEKVKKCHDFIKYFKVMELNHQDIIRLLYKSNITYDKLYKIKSEDYENLKIFFKERIYFLNIKKTDGLVKNGKTEIKRNTEKDSLLTYVGTKHNYIDIIKKHMNNVNENTKIFDLFGGSLSIPYELNKIYPNNKFIVNDINPFLVNFYEQVKNNVNILLDKIHELNTDENIKNYKTLLHIINDEYVSNIEKAAVYFILNKISYNGRIFYKDNKISIHCYRKKKINVKQDKFENFNKFLNNIEINNVCLLDNEEYWLNTINKNDIIILDPPYDIININNSHYLYNFNRAQQEKLFIFINKLLEKNIKVITFNGDTKFIKRLYRNLNQCVIESKTSINLCKPYKELLIYN